MEMYKEKVKFNESELIDDLLQFLNRSPTAWHAVENCVEQLKRAHFTPLKEGEAWDIRPGGKYYVVRNGSTLCAFTIPEKKTNQIRLVASHTDSPTFKLKPKSEFYQDHMLMLGLEMYGSPVISSWLNRDLGIAGRVIFTNPQGVVQDKLVRLDLKPVVIPQLAIHLDRAVNDQGPTLNKQHHLCALASVDTEKKDPPNFLLNALKELLPINHLLCSDLLLFPLEGARLFGEHKQLISSYRIDSLLSVHAALTAMVTHTQNLNHTINMVVFWDNEEIGSETAQGAGSPFAVQVIERILLSLKLTREECLRMMSVSSCISVDLCHAVHPNYKDKHEPNHPVFLNQGIALKTNAQHRYAGDLALKGSFVKLCNDHHIPLQYYVARGDIPAGSTIGPIHSTISGMPTIDIGVPQLSMHCSKEIAGVHDHLDMCRVLAHYFTL